MVVCAVARIRLTLWASAQLGRTARLDLQVHSPALLVRSVIMSVVTIGRPIWELDTIGHVELLWRLRRRKVSLMGVCTLVSLFRRYGTVISASLGRSSSTCTGNCDAGFYCLFTHRSLLTHTSVRPVVCHQCQLHKRAMS